MAHARLGLHDGGQDTGLAGVELLASHVPGVARVNLFTHGRALGEEPWTTN